MDVKKTMLDIGIKARAASRSVLSASPGDKNNALQIAASKLRKSEGLLIRENEKDIQAAKKNGLSSAMIDRLRLTQERIEDMALAVEEIVSLPDPVGEVTKIWNRPSGFRVGRMRVPIGVIGIIYESRPNVTIDAAALCLKSGNACILRGGSEAIHSNTALAALFQEGLAEAGLPPEVAQAVPTTDRAAVRALLTLDDHVDMIIPRGGKPLIRMIMENSTIPVVKHLDGVCHTYVDADADQKMAEEICINAKLNRPGTCNAMETLLVHTDIAENFLPGLLGRLKNEGVELNGCEVTRKIVPEVEKATDEDWKTEYLEKILSVKVVENIDEAMDHIADYGSAHTDCIVTESHRNAERFLREVDSSSVMVNASTRLSDGFIYGLGAEIGISTDKLHARGPMGLEELTCQKFIVLGEGHLRD